MSKHSKFNEVKTLINANFAVLLIGSCGTGKTHLAKQVSESLDLDFYNISMTRQTTLSHLLGFMSVNGTYIPSFFKKAVEFGGLFLLDEIDAADANVLLALNTLENGYMSFPTGIVNCHPKFRLIATANPQDNHDAYVGRSKLDAATLDRFDIIEIARDANLEKSLVDLDTFSKISLMRSVLHGMNSHITISMRDSIRYQKRKDLNLLDNFMYRISGSNDLAMSTYEEHAAMIPKYLDQSECVTFSNLITLATKQEKPQNDETDSVSNA